MLKRSIVLIISLLATAALHAQSNPSEATGKVVDQEGNPVQGALLTFTAKSNPSVEYTGKTNKKGRYFVPGLFSPQGDEWNVAIEAESYLPVTMVIESRTVNKTLVGDIRTVNLKPGASLPAVVIKALGTARIEFTLAPEDQVRKQQQQQALAQAAASGATAAPAPTRDPWNEALGLANDGDFAGATPLFAKAIEAEPEDGERREVYAKILVQSERYDEAEPQALKAIELMPGNLEARMVLYTVYASRGELDRALETLQAAREVAPGDTRILEQMAYIADTRGDGAGAIEAYEAITEVDPQHSAAWLALGDLYARKGDMTKSEQAYQHAVEVDTASAHQVFYNLGALIMNKPDRSEVETQKAIDAFRKAIAHKPDYAQAYKQLAFALLGTGDRSGAAESLAAYVDLAAGTADADQMKRLLATLQQ